MSKKVTELPVATKVNDTDLLMIVQDGQNKQVSADKLLATAITINRWEEN